jgi:septum formation protein
LASHPTPSRPPDIDEDPKTGELPRAYCARIAADKVAAVEARRRTIVLCADTTVALGRRIMGKPEDAAEAAPFLTLLSGRRHRVYTALAVKRGDRIWTVSSKAACA